VIARLRALGMTQLVMLSGDNQRVADAVARSVGIDRAMGDLMPEAKVEAIKKLRAAGDVAMVGDGVNDAPALAVRRWASRWARRAPTLRSRRRTWR
jgi:Cd2+/Zn2+-exporting ATPase